LGEAVAVASFHFVEYRPPRGDDTGETGGVAPVLHQGVATSLGPAELLGRQGDRVSRDCVCDLRLLVVTGKVGLETGTGEGMPTLPSSS